MLIDKKMHVGKFGKSRKWGSKIQIVALYCQEVTNDKSSEPKRIPTVKGANLNYFSFFFFFFNTTSFINASSTWLVWLHLLFFKLPKIPFVPFPSLSHTFTHRQWLKKKHTIYSHFWASRDSVALNGEYWEDSARMWSKYAGVLIWKTKNPWNGLSLRGQFYDHLLS